VKLEFVLVGNLPNCTFSSSYWLLGLLSSESRGSSCGDSGLVEVALTDVNSAVGGGANLTACWIEMF
jgi:hypothetical protein